jgi:hypothetical protein
LNFADLPRTSSSARECVRWNPKTKRYELVVGGVVLSSISRVGMSIRSERMKFRAQVAATADVVKRVRKKHEEADRNEAEAVKMRTF